MNKRKTALGATGPDALKKKLISMLCDNARTHRMVKVFSDFVELSALAISNAVNKLDTAQWQKREARYMQIVGGYQRDEVLRFQQMFCVLVDWLECGFADCLSDLFMSLDMGDSFKGQFFTPYPVSSMMAQMTAGDVRAQVKQSGFITVCEPACGAGGMLVAFADAVHSQGINYQQVMHATAIDIDSTAVHMAYIQLALYHVPAIIIHGNALAMTEWDHFVTPAHVLGGWDFKLRRRLAQQMASGMMKGEANGTLHVIPTLPEQQAPKVRHSGSHTPEDVATAAHAIVKHRAEQLGLF